MANYYANFVLIWHISALEQFLMLMLASHSIFNVAAIIGITRPYRDALNQMAKSARTALFKKRANVTTANSERQIQNRNAEIQRQQL